MGDRVSEADPAEPNTTVAAVRTAPLLTLRLWRLAIGTGSAVQVVASASDRAFRRLQPGPIATGRGAVPEYGATGGESTEGGEMDAEKERVALAREIQGCDVRLGLLPPAGQEPRNEAFRAELEQRRVDALQRLAQLEAA